MPKYYITITDDNLTLEEQQALLDAIMDSVSTVQENAAAFLAAFPEIESQPDDSVRWAGGAA